MQTPGHSGAAFAQLLADAAARTQVSAAARRQAARAFLDTVGVALAGADDPAVAAVRRASDPLPPGVARVLADGARTRPEIAALLNATAAHALDLDDVSHSVKGHPSAVLVPVLLALGEAHGLSGRALTDSYVVGVQTGAALWAALGPAHYARGWHATATIGCVAAAAAASRALHLDVPRASAALGVAAAFSTGSRQSFGSMVKPLAVGHAAESGLRATQLALAGMVPDPHQLDGPFGLLALTGNGAVEDALSVMDSPSVLVGERGLNVKRYPCCYFAHRAADAMLELPRITADQIASIRVTTSPGALSALKHPRPSTGTEAKFSGPFIVAAAYLDRGLTLDTFTDEAVERVDIASLAGRIRWCESELPPHGPETWLDGYAVVELDTRRGATHVVRVDHPRGHAAYPLDDAELVTKFRDCARGRLRAGDLEVLAAELLHLDRSDDTTWQHADLTQCHSDSVKGI